ncbi:DUF3574 domain-containing protein [Tahibacter caeni]|uniref:DUF3574 domain-containing protein n=1 Tax=Tahibacter caeni TaxID=1453545 RepID=UPI002148BDFC|nr:DUF3574 domain-containing protein [Tahibacter caeni]
MRHFALAICLLLPLGACRSLPPAACARGDSAVIEDRLFFGLSRPDGTTIAEAQWQAFLRDEVTPRFPQGLTVVDASGQWRNADGSLSREASRVLTLAHADDAANEAAVVAIVQAYKRAFDQEAVLRLKQAACASF